MEKEETINMFNFQNSYINLPEAFFVAQNPKPVSAPKLIMFNYSLAKDLGIHVENTTDQLLADIFSGNVQPKGAQPLAMAYSGHQFANFVPTLGDGRANLMGEVIAKDNKRYDVQLKGSGPTAFSRNGDGRSALGPVIREYLLSEAMHVLNVPTTRALACVLSGEKVQRETVLAGGIFTRVAQGHIRVGTFQYFASRQDLDNLRTLTKYSIERFYPDLKDEKNLAYSLLQRVIERQAFLVAKWMSIGFIHGVMNTDNVSIAGETIDYGPAAYMDEYNPATVFSFIDKGGRYAYANQASIAQWNLARLAESLLPMIDDDGKIAVTKAQEALEGFAEHFNKSWLTLMGAKIGIADVKEGDTVLVKGLLELMEYAQADFTNTFRGLAHFLKGDSDSLFETLENNEALEDWLVVWQNHLSKNGTKMQDVANNMNAVNPIYIPRNHLVEEAIKAAYQNDFSKFETLGEVLSSPYVEHEGMEDYTKGPTDDQRVQNTFCGT